LSDEAPSDPVSTSMLPRRLFLVKFIKRLKGEWSFDIFRSGRMGACCCSREDLEEAGLIPRPSPLGGCGEVERGGAGGVKVEGGGAGDGLSEREREEEDGEIMGSDAALPPTSPSLTRPEGVAGSGRPVRLPVISLESGSSDDLAVAVEPEEVRRSFLAKNLTIICFVDIP